MARSRTAKQTTQELTSMTRGELWAQLEKIVDPTGVRKYDDDAIEQMLTNAELLAQFHIKLIEEEVGEVDLAGDLESIAASAAKAVVPVTKVAPAGKDDWKVAAMPIGGDSAKDILVHVFRGAEAKAKPIGPAIFQVMRRYHKDPVFMEKMERAAASIPAYRAYAPGVVRRDAPAAGKSQPTFF